MRPDELAAAVVAEMRAALAPVVERLAKLETTIDHRFALVGKDFEHTPTRDEITIELVGIRERLAVVETRPPLAGPPGVDGAPGKDGEPGPPGPPGLEYKNSYNPGQAYERGHVVTYAGSAWHCSGPTDHRPGDGGPGWVLMVKRGADAKGAK